LFGRFRLFCNKEPKRLAAMLAAAPQFVNNSLQSATVIDKTRANMGFQRLSEGASGSPGGPNGCAVVAAVPAHQDLSVAVGQRTRTIDRYAGG
jgi:hypothetical protein